MQGKNYGKKGLRFNARLGRDRGREADDDVPRNTLYLQTPALFFCPALPLTSSPSSDHLGFPVCPFSPPTPQELIRRVCRR